MRTIIMMGARTVSDLLVLVRARWAWVMLPSTGFQNRLMTTISGCATAATRRNAISSSFQQQQCRALAAYGTNWKTKPSSSTKKRRRSTPAAAAGKASSLLLTSVQSSAGRERSRESSKPTTIMLPPAVLLPTASPHVFVSKYAVETHSSTSTMFRAEAAGDVDLARIRPRCRYHGTSPPPDSASLLPEVAFLGRSNVGKSSLMNALSGQPLQRVGKQPGRTQHPHYVECSSTTTRGTTNILGYLMDLPGYGFGVGPESAVDAWQRRTQQSLLRRRDVGALRRVYVLVDARHGATTLDLSVMSWLEEGEIPFTIALTKSDATSPMFVVKHANQICMRYHHEASSSASSDDVMISPLVHVTSAKNKTGLVELWSSVLRDFQDE